MSKSNTQEVKSSRDRLQSRMSEAYPDKKFGTANVENGETVDDLEQAVLDKLDEQGKTIDEYRQKDEALVKLMMSDPQCADFIDEWVRSGDPRAALVKVFGDDLSELGTEEGRGKFADGLQSWRTRKQENDNLIAEADANWNSFLDRLDKWGDEKGLDIDRKKDIAVRLIDVYDKGLTNAYDESDFEMANKALGYDNDVASARQEGIVDGRNQKIVAQRRTKNDAGNMPPSMSGGRGMHTPAPQPPKPYNIWDEVE